MSVSRELFGKKINRDIIGSALYSVICCLYMYIYFVVLVLLTNMLFINRSFTLLWIRLSFPIMTELSLEILLSMGMCQTSVPVFLFLLLWRSFETCVQIIAKEGFTCVKCMFVINVIVSKVAFHTIFAIKIFKMLVEERFFFQNRYLNRISYE